METTNAWLKPSIESTPEEDKCKIMKKKPIQHELFDIDLMKMLSSKCHIKSEESWKLCGSWKPNLGKRKGFEVK